MDMNDSDPIPPEPIPDIVYEIGEIVGDFPQGDE
jgi:hypothetical protein